MLPDATVFVVDDDDQARNSVCALVRSMGLAAESFSSAEGFLAAYEDPGPGCLVTDVRMMGMSGLELQEALHKRGLTLPVIVITAHARTPLTVRAMKLGAVTLLEKPYEDDDLWDAIREALKIDHSSRQRRAHRQELRRRIDTLTDKERETMRLVIAGKANKVIARHLDVSIRTVESRRHNLFQKLQVDSVAELVQLVMEAELSERQ